MLVEMLNQMLKERLKEMIYELEVGDMFIDTYGDYFLIIDKGENGIWIFDFSSSELKTYCNNIEVASIIKSNNYKIVEK